jgi:hypothetical protein
MQSCALQKQLGLPLAQLREKSYFMPIAKLCHNLMVIATPGHGFYVGPAPCGHQVARNNEKPKPFKKHCSLVCACRQCNALESQLGSEMQQDFEAGADPVVTPKRVSKV